MRRTKLLAAALSLAALAACNGGVEDDGTTTEPVVDTTVPPVETTVPGETTTTTAAN